MTEIRSVLHTYRALLRQTGKLIYPQARDHFSKTIRDAFREHRNLPALPQEGRVVADSMNPRTRRLLRRARAYLYMLERANRGHLHAVAKTLELCYGRRGVQRRTQIQHYLHAEISTVKISDRDWEPSSSFKGLMRAQMKVHHLLPLTGKLKPLPPIPEQNRVGQPFPQARVKGLHTKWYAKTAQHLKPPLPEKEWESVYNLATGKARIDLSHVQTVEQGTDLENKADEDDKLVVQLSSTSSRRSSPHSFQQRKISVGRPHTITPRFARRRVMHTVLQQTPLAIYDEKTQTTKYRWEIGPASIRQPRQLSASAALSLFG